METDTIKADSVWHPVGPDSRVGGGFRYSLTIAAKKLTASDGTPVVRVSITKHIQNQADFFAPIENVATDGLEEEAILYRIRRELQIDRLLTHTNRG